MRCVGGQGSGHGSYSDPLVFTTTGSREPVSKAASVMSEASSSTAGDNGRALTLGSASKGRKGGMPRPEAESLVPAQPSSNKVKKKIRKGGGAGETSVPSFDCLSTAGQHPCFHCAGKLVLI